MQLINQPEGTSLCGQCVVAMLAGVPLEEAIACMGSGRNYPRDIKKSLATFGLSIPARSTPGAMEPPCGRGAALLWGERSHWVAWDDGVWFDPARPHLLASVDFYKPSAVALYPVSTT